MAKRVKLPIQDKRIEDLLMWRDTKKSGIVFGGITALYILICWSGISMLYILSWLAMVLTGSCYVWANFGSTLKLPTPQSVLPKFLDDGISEKQIKDLADKHLDKINKALEYVRKVVYGQDIKLTGMIVGVLMLYIFILSKISILGIGYMVAVIAFVAPKFYEMRKDEVDKFLVQAQDKSKEYMKVVQQQSKVYMKQVQDKVGAMAAKAEKKTE